MKNRIGWVLFVAYCGFLLWLTIFSREPRVGERVFKWELFWSYRAWIAGKSYGKTESIQNVNNILLFIPFGMLFPGTNWKELLLTAILFSVSIEAVQFVFNLGWCEIDDVICNLMGTVTGFGLWKCVKGKFNVA